MENLDETFLKNANRSVARKVADNLSKIEEAISLGISQAEIIEYLSKQGITVTYFNFRTILQRLRKKKLKSEFPKQMKAIATHRQEGKETVNQNSQAVNTVAHSSGTSTKSNPTENKVGSALVGQVKEATIVADTWRERRKQIVDF